ncbi:unnamed protein product [Nippostrongylus brasiliensis]|uniref:Gem-associated protein 2 (inferred by orthology to a human protein) n=1 Tax=Nippostrongylus brasiliensis TaxID=27835 RepID=A0A0N4XIY3_NIPBR|nr:unnamed protein product [Nippostrongylus brasiliensis]
MRILAQKVTIFAVLSRVQCKVSVIQNLGLLQSDAERWEEVLLRRCHPKCEHFMPHFPHHQGTPPAVPVVLSISSTMVNTLISYAVEWAEDEFTRALREWLFALLLIIEKPLLPDVCAALRALASTCRRLRSRTDMKRSEVLYSTNVQLSLIPLWRYCCCMMHW